MCNLSKGMISKIESGKVMPAVATLSRIAHALNVKVSLLMEEGIERETVCESTLISLDEFNKSDVGYRFHALATGYGDKQIQPLVFYAKKGEVLTHRVSHQGEECIFIIEGNMHFTVGDTQYFLQQNDFLYFDGVHTHGIDNVDNEVRYLNLFYDSDYANRVFLEK